MLHVNSLELIYSSPMDTLVLLYFTESSFLCRFRVESVDVLFFHDSIFARPTFSSSTNNFEHAKTLSRMSSLSGRMNIGQVNIEFLPGCKKIKQRCISFVLGYLRMILWKMSTTIYLYGFLNQSLGLILGNIFFY